MLYCVSVVFFFKQKTAYEVRIGDWSSDVCSSDLVVAVLRQKNPVGIGGAEIARDRLDPVRLARRAIFARGDREAPDIIHAGQAEHRIGVIDMARRDQLTPALVVDLREAFDYRDEALVYDGREEARGRDRAARVQIQHDIRFHAT